SSTSRLVSSTGSLGCSSWRRSRAARCGSWCSRQSGVRTFYLGTHRPNWLGLLNVPLFVSHRTLGPRKSLPKASHRWALDSGGFTELSMHGKWLTGVDEYVEAVHRYSERIGLLAWAA